MPHSPTRPPFPPAPIPPPPQNAQRLGALEKQGLFDSPGLKAAWESAFLGLLRQLCTSPAIAPELRDEFFTKVERLFMAGLRSSSPSLRASYFSLYHEHVPATLFDRFHFVFMMQDWEAMAGQFWLKQALDLVLSILKDEERIMLAPNSAQIPPLIAGTSQNVFEPQQQQRGQGQRQGETNSQAQGQDVKAEPGQVNGQVEGQAGVKAEPAAQGGEGAAATACPASAATPASAPAAETGVGAAAAAAAGAPAAGGAGGQAAVSVPAAAGAVAVKPEPEAQGPPSGAIAPVAATTAAAIAAATVKAEAAAQQHPQQQPVPMVPTAAADAAAAPPQQPATAATAVAAAAAAAAFPSEPTAAMRRFPVSPEVLELLQRHAVFLEGAGRLKVSDMLSSLREYSSVDPSVANHLWVLVFPIVWATLEKLQQIQLAKPIINLLSKEYHQR